MKPPVRIELPTIFGMKTVNAYLFVEPEPVLIDCGENTPASWEALEYGLRQQNLEWTDLRRIIITHAHVDHIGMANRVATASGADVWVNELCYDWALQPASMWTKRVEMLRQLMLADLPKGAAAGPLGQIMQSFSDAVIQVWEPLPPECLQTFPVDGQLRFGGALWKVIYAPGHTNMQTCFYQPDSKYLVAADMLLHIAPTPVIEFALDQPDQREKGMLQLLESYQKMLELDIETVYPGHGVPFSNHRRVIRRQLARIEQRQAEVYRLIQNGQHRFFDLFTSLYNNPMNLPGMSMLRGYLDLLMEAGMVVEKTSGVRRSFHSVTQTVD